MTMRAFVLASSLLGFGGLARAEGPARSPAPAGADVRPTFWVVPHSHWEGAVFKTREEYLAMGLPNIAKALRLLDEQPAYRYTIDQVAYIRPFLERYPEHTAAFKKHLAEGRLQIVGGLDVMPDVNMPGGETFVRQMSYGKGYLREALGVDVTTGWLVDTFGQHAQLPQLLTQGGFTSFWFVRGVPKQEHPSEFSWEGIDGTRIPAYYLPHSYVVMYPTPKTPDAFKTFARQRFNALTPNSVPGADRVGISAADVSEPEEHQAPLIDAANRSGDLPFTLRLGVPADYEKAVAARGGTWPVFRGELNPIFQGTYSSRIELKGWMRSMETRLLNAEKLAALAGWLGAPVDRAGLLDAWEPVLFNQTHDLASGVMTDHVYADTIRGYEFARRNADNLIDRYWDTLAQAVDTRTKRGVPIVVFNPLGFVRDDVVEIDLAFTRKGVREVIAVDDADEHVPTQIVSSTRDTDGSLRTARVALMVRGVPALGHRLVRLINDTSPPPSVSPSEKIVEKILDDTNDLLGGRCIATVDRSTGAISGLSLKSDDWEALAAPANVVAREVDKGDLWEPYRGLDGASRVAMTTRRDVPTPDKALLSDREKASIPGEIRRGSVFDELTVKHSFGSGTFATTVRTLRDLRRVEVTTKLVNNEKFVRYVGLFPTTIKKGKSAHEIPFGSIERPEGIEFPAQNWVDHGDGKHGLAILNAGLPGHATTDGTIMVSLMRSHALGAYGFGGGYEPGMSADSGYQLGQERTMRYALVPHAGTWAEAGIPREALAFNHPLIARKVEPHPGRLPARWGLVEVSNPDVIISAVRPGPAATIFVRLYESSGRPAPGVTLTMAAPMREAVEVNLIDDPSRLLTPQGRAVTLDLRPFEIKTLRLSLLDPPPAP